MVERAHVQIRYEGRLHPRFQILAVGGKHQTVDRHLLATLMEINVSKLSVNVLAENVINRISWNKRVIGKMILI